MRVVVAGSSGFLGLHLVDHLRERGHDVVRLVRRPPEGADEATWDPDRGIVDTEAVHGSDAVINLAGSPTIGNPHSKRWARELRESRVKGTRLLAETIASAPTPPAFLAGNAIAFYGDHGAAEVTEASGTRGDALLTEVCREWQAATVPASEAGARVAVLRTAPVLDREAAPLKQLRLLFSTGLGARLGDGRQYFPVISLRDWIGGVTHVLEGDLAGPVNLCCPSTPTNAVFTKALAAAVRRPAVLFAPAPIIRAAAGPMAPEVLGSIRLRPVALQEDGYGFRDQDVTAVLAAGLARG